MKHTELIQRALDSNAFKSSDTAAGYINPEFWDTNLFDHVRSNLIALPLGLDVTSRFEARGGDTYNLTVLAEPARASSVAETASVSIVSYAPTQVVLSPTEYGIAYEVTDKELRRAFFDVMEDMTRNVGYGLALEADRLAMSQLTNSAGNSIVANGVAESALASSDTLDYNDIVNAMTANAVDKFSSPVALIVHPTQAGALMKDSTFATAEKFGADRAANRNGFIGTVVGTPVYMTTQVQDDGSNAQYAILLSASDAFAYIHKTPMGGALAMDYTAIERKNQIVGVLDFDVKVTRANAICTIATYTA